MTPPRNATWSLVCWLKRQTAFWLARGCGQAVAAERFAKRGWLSLESRTATLEEGVVKKEFGGRARRGEACDFGELWVGGEGGVVGTLLDLFRCDAIESFQLLL